MGRGRGCLYTPKRLFRFHLPQLHTADTTHRLEVWGIPLFFLIFKFHGLHDGLVQVGEERQEHVRVAGLAAANVDKDRGNAPRQQAHQHAQDLSVLVMRRR